MNDGLLLTPVDTLLPRSQICADKSKKIQHGVTEMTESTAVSADVAFSLIISSWIVFTDALICVHVSD